VTAHIDTAADFVVAVHSGVNELAHAPLPEPGLPGGYEPYVIPFAAAAAAATRGVTVVATASVVPRLHGAHWTAAERAAVAAVHKRNLQVMKQWSVRLAVGSDGISGEVPFATARSEIEYLRGHGMLDGLALLRMWAVNTPRTIFPDRKIGDLRSGYEANFLVLEGDPISDAANLHRIWMKVKSGKVLPQR
jgi:imidazolonepropionase-like amidohydrolase